MNIPGVLYRKGVRKAEDPSAHNSNYYRNGEDIHFKPLTHEEERALFVKAKSGDADAREFLIRNHLLFVARYGTKKSKNRLPNDEVVSAMNEALMAAIDRFDPSYANRFRRYLIPFLAGAMADLWRSKNTVDLPKPKPGDGFVGTSQQFVGFPNHLDDRTNGNDESGSRREKRIQDDAAMEDINPTPEEAAGESSYREYLVEVISKIRKDFTEQENQLLDLIYVSGMNCAEAARAMKVSRQRGGQIHNQCLLKLRRRLPGNLSKE